ncbi:MAG: cytochrome bc complex cytochrome b subunit [Candidatus Methanofastidiosia archaeon]
MKKFFEERFDLKYIREKAKAIDYNIMRTFPKSHTEDYRHRAVWLWYPFYALGGVTIVCFLILLITGIILTFYYIPSVQGEPSEAYESVNYIMTEVPFGYIIRAVHHWAAHLMIASAFLHMLRVYFTKAYTKPREINWVLGLNMLLITLFLGYTGYILPWDQLSYWAGKIGQEILLSVPIFGEIFSNLFYGGIDMSQKTLSRFYALHIYLLPMLLTVLILVHCVIVWLQGIAEPH